MSNNYMQFSETIKLETPQEVQWWTQKIQQANEEEECIDYYIEPPSENRPATLHIMAEESGDIEVIADKVQEYLKEFHPNDYFTLTWSNTCSSMIQGAFAGGGLFVTANEQQWESSYAWINRKKQEFEDKGKPDPKQAVVDAVMNAEPGTLDD